MQGKMRLILQILQLAIYISSFEKFAVSTDRADTEAMTSFGIDLFKKIAGSTDLRENILYSPFSVYASMRVLQLASKGTSRAQIEKAIQWSKANQNNQGQDIVEQFQNTFTSKSEGNNKLAMAFRLCQQKYFCTVACNKFMNALKRLQKNDLGQLNFVSSPSDARKNINKWVELKTLQNIKNLIPEGNINSYTRMILSEAVHFKGNWKFKFPAKKTKLENFYTIGKDGRTSRKQVPFMSITETFNFIYGKNRKYGIVEIPFSGDALSMIIIIPNRSTAIRDLESDLSTTFVIYMLRTLKRQRGIKIELQIPRFKLEVGMNLRRQLEALNIRDIFHPIRADLSGIVGYRGLSVWGIYHKAGVDVDESGATAFQESAEFVPRLSINKPFLFFVYDKKTGIILLMGRMMNPTAN